MNESPVTQFGVPDAPYCGPATARVTIIPVPLEHSVCYMKGTEYRPQAILLVSTPRPLPRNLPMHNHRRYGCS